MQLTLDSIKAEELKVAGQNTIEANDHAFVAQMREEAKRLSQLNGSVTTDELRVFGCARGLYPKHPNTWGSLFRGLHWVIIGRQKSALPSNRHRELKVWRWEE